jgi:hypothetical protein
MLYDDSVEGLSERTQKPIFKPERKKKLPDYVLIGV